MKIAVVGVGALGCLLGAYLSEVNEVILIGHWPAQVARIREQGLWLERPDGQRTHHSPAITDNPHDAGPASVALVAVKSRQTGEAAGAIGELLDAGGLVITLQNGLNNLARLRGALGDNRVALGVTSEGATILGPGEVRHAGRGLTHFGRDPALGQAQRDLLAQVASLFNVAGLEAHLIDNTDGLMWGKLAVNAAINPLTALLRVPNGFLIEHEELVDIMRLAAYEVAAVAKRQGIALPYSDAAERAIEVARATAANHSSMLQDVLRGAPTEIDAICGAITRIGRELSVPTPVNFRLWQLVKRVEEGDAPLEAAGDVAAFYRLMELDQR
jgi:2-dehydropantoate 2-reductase